MNINFASQTNSQNCSFGQWKRLTIKNFDNVVKRAYAVRDIIEVNPKARACFQRDGETPFNVSNSLFGIIEYIQNPIKRKPQETTINVYGNSKFHRKLFNALKECLKAPTAEEAIKISRDATEKFIVKA